MKPQKRNAKRVGRSPKKRETDSLPLREEWKASAHPGTEDLPPNEQVQKHPDEVYGDTEIPHRRKAS
jgi:hypothetical protein